MDSQLQQIAQYYMLHGSFLPSLGLFNGKMGLVLFFFHYSRYIQNPLYEEFAGELLDEVFEDVHEDIPIYFADGLCGIGWGIVYLFQQKFVDGNVDDVLKSLDNKLLEYNLLKMNNHSLETGLLGIASYIRIRLVLDIGRESFFDTAFLQVLCVACPVNYSIQQIQAEIIRGSDGDNNLSWKKGLKIIWDQSSI
ncbi:hypothetical protein [Bacteroides fragilis]|uniref:hypothetical protein n=1 Tax=Bacteroides fragilis TaxID=817 RepID=UPI00202EC173|nr:hypothetical protein [Bacteroides fragilis]MCM0315714.1 hypothetical protein [Bacteroides fragilis]